MNNEYLEELANKIRYKKEDIGNNTYRLYLKKTDIEFLEKALQRLEAIDNAKPSEALMFIQALLDISETEKHFINLANYDTRLNLVKTKQTLIKSQEQEKMLEIIKEKYVDLNLLDCDDDVGQYNRHFGKDRQLTEEEFDLLKEML